MRLLFSKLVSPRFRMLTILLTSSIAFLSSVIAPGLPDLYAEFSNVENAQLLSRLVLTIPMLFLALFGPFVGLIVDKYGRRKTLIFSIVGFGFAGLSGLVLETLTAILISRAILGIFLVGILTSVTALIGDYYSGEERNKVAGYQSASISFGTLIYTFLAGLLAEIDWSATFVVFGVALVLVVPIVVSLYEPDTTQDKSSQISSKETSRKDFLIIFGIYILTFLAMVLLFMVPSQIPFFLVDIDVLSPFEAGLAVGLFSLSGGISSLIFPWLRRQFGVSLLFALVFADISICYILISTSTDIYDVVIALLIGGFSVGAFLPNATLVILARSAPIFRGRALSCLTAAFFLGQFTSPLYSLPIIKWTSLGQSFFYSGVLAALVSTFFIFMIICLKIREYN